MRALTSKEKKLLLVLLGAIFLLANLVGLQAFLNRQRSLQASITRLDGELSVSRAVLEDKDFWATRGAWLEKNQPADDLTTKDDDTEFTNFLSESAQRNNLEIVGTDYPEGATDKPYVEVVFRLKVKGAIESVVRWLSELQAPQEFRAIKEISIRSDAEPPRVIADVEVARWYRGSEGGQP